MSDGVPRLRMFAGPNGSGKTTVKQNLGKSADWFGIYINPGDLEKTIRETAFLSLTPYSFGTTSEEVRQHFAASELLKNKGLSTGIESISCGGGGISFEGVQFSSYHASALSDFLRRKALANSLSFSFETVMSARDKVELLREAQTRGFRTYLYFIATEDPAINVQRVKNRVADGGHDVPSDKIIARYHRSLQLLLEAIPYTNRAYFFDTSEENAWYFAEATDGVRMELKGDEAPNWFVPVWEHFDTGAAPEPAQ
jgi:predicted ABC-type ATPase